MLRWRLTLGTLFVLAIAGLLSLDALLATAGWPGVGLLPLLVVVVVLGTGELLDLMGAVELRAVAWAAHTGTLLVAVSPFVALFWPNAQLGAGEWVMLALAAGLALAVVAEMARYEQPGRSIAGLAAAGLSLVYMGLMVAITAELRISWGLEALAALLIVVKLGDIGAYTVGRLIGRHKLAPTLSPGKTIEGAAGAIAFSTAGAWGVFRVLASFGAAPGPWWGWMVFGVAVAVAGMVGDLAESLLKRDAGRKDSSRWMPGFGGVLDLVDSVLLAAPVAYACWALGVMGG